MTTADLTVGKKIRSIVELESRIKNGSVPKGTVGVIAYRGDNAIMVDFKNVIYGSWSISHNVALKSFEEF